MLKRSIRKWRRKAERYYREGVVESLAGDYEPKRVLAGWFEDDFDRTIFNMAYVAGGKEAQRAKGGKWPVAVTLPDKVWARILAVKLGRL